MGGVSKGKGLFSLKTAKKFILSYGPGAETSSGEFLQAVQTYRNPALFYNRRAAVGKSTVTKAGEESRLTRTLANPPFTQMVHVGPNQPSEVEAG